MIAKRTSVDLSSLDVLRGVLALYVLLGHARWLLWAGHAHWIAQPHVSWEVPLAYSSALLRFGHHAVMVFFVLSGFFIHWRMAQALANREPLSFRTSSFFWRRLHRLGPPYAMALAITVAADLLGTHLCPALYAGRVGDALLDENFARKGYSISSVIPALLGLPSAFGTDFGSNGPLWSLAYEIVYYALYPGWLMLRRRSAVLGFGSAAVIFLIMSLLPPIPFLSVVLLHYPLWIGGALLAELVNRGTLHKSLSCGLGFVAFLGAELSPTLIWRMPFWLIAGSATVLFFLWTPSWIAFLRVWTLFRRLGEASYSIYIFHFPLLTLAAAMTFKSFGARPVHGWVALLGALAATLVSYGSFWICERHFLHRPSGGLPLSQSPLVAATGETISS